MSYHSEIEKENMVEKYKKENTAGFQGCANLGKGCDFKGFYLYRYSAEGLCEDCELREHSNIFYGCGFCGKAIRSSAFCIGCEEGFKQWMIDLFCNNDKKSQSSPRTFKVSRDYKREEYDFWYKISIGCTLIIQKCDSCVLKFPIRHMARTGSNQKWPGFHLGDDKYYTPDPLSPTLKSKINMTDLTWDNKETVMMREIFKLGVIPMQTIQTNKSLFETEMVYIVD